MSKAQSGTKLAEICESLSDITLTVVADLLGDFACGGVPVILRLGEIGISVFPVGVVGEDEAGQKILHALQHQKIATSGISRIKNYQTPSSAGEEQVHGEHPALLNLIEHARKFASASDGMYVCDYGIGAASPRLLNFIKSNGCVREKTLGARSLHRLTDFEQLTTAVSTVLELEQAIGIAIGEDEQKLSIAAEGMRRELRAASFVALSGREMLVVSKGQKPTRHESSDWGTSAKVDLFGGVFTASLSTGAEARECAELAAKLVTFFDSRSPGSRTRREELLDFLAPNKSSRTVR